jgi:hypothetical protein
MRKGVDKFDLRDDEWMMVEDELLRTAKMFTRHLHLAEYERMKADMEERTKHSTPRPVVADAKPSVDGHFNRKAKEQMKTQKKALREINAAPAHDEDQVPRPKHTASITVTRPTGRPQRDLTTQRMKTNTKSASDSDDLDTPKYPAKHAATPNKLNPPRTETDSDSTPTEFVKPALPLNARARAKLRRPTPFDMWDDYTPNQPSPPSQTSPTTRKQGPSSAPKVRASTTIKPTVSIQPASTTVDLFSGLDYLKRDRLSKETSDRLAKRKAEREKETPSKSAKSIDDIPTFLF